MEILKTNLMNHLNVYPQTESMGMLEWVLNLELFDYVNKLYCRLQSVNCVQQMIFVTLHDFNHKTSQIYGI